MNFDKTLEDLMKREISMTNQAVFNFIDNFDSTSKLMTQFKKACINIRRDYSKFDMALDQFMKSDDKTFLVDIFNAYIGFSLPTENIISLIYDTFMTHKKMYPHAKFVDLGTGTGIYPWLLNRKGIAKEDLVAVDLPSDEQVEFFNTIYWDDIVRNKSYTPNVDDMVFISWGYGRYPALDRYLLTGGKCVIIIGEHEGCTLHVDFFAINWNHYSEDSDADIIEFAKSLHLTSTTDKRGAIPSDDLKFAIKDWKTTICVIDTVNLHSQDYLSINTKYD